MAKTPAEHEKSRREKLKAMGREKLELWPMKEHKPLIKEYASKLEKGS